MDSNTQRNLDEIKVYLDDTLKSISAKFSEAMSDAIQDAVDGVDAKVLKSVSNDLSKTFRSLIKLSDDIATNQYKINKGLLSSKDVAKQINSIEEKRILLNTKIKNAKLLGVELDKEDIIATRKSLSSQLRRLKVDEDRVKQIEKATVGSRAFADVVSKIPGLSKFIDTKSLTQELMAGKGQLNSWSVISKHVFENFKALAGPLALAYIAQQILVADENTTKLAKSLNQTKTEAAGTQIELSGMAMASGNAYLNTSKLVEATVKLGQQLGIAKVFSADVTTEFALLTGRMGLAEESAAGLAKMSVILGKNSHNVTTEALGTAQALQSQAGIQLDNKQILEEVGKVSGQLLANFQASPAKIAAAVTQAKLLGTTLETTKKQSESLLDFQSSIENELKAELITGQQLNLERARGAALMGDQETVMKELASQNVNFTKFSQMNVIAQKDLAAALGLSTDELADQLAKQQFIGKSRAEVAAIAGEEVANRLQALTVQERFTASMQKLQDALTPVLTALAFVLDKTVRLVTLDFKGLVGADDLMSGYGNRTLSTPQGIYALNNNDTVIAGTNLFRGNDVYSGPAGALSLGGGGDVVDAITKLGDRINQLSERPVIARPSEFTGPITIKQQQNIRRSI
jgi:hypothetical protein